MSDFNLNDKATQTGFAELLKVSQQSISKQYKKGVLHSGGTYHEWLLQYTEHLRNEAAGRGGDSQQLLTLARIEESREKTAAMRLSRLKDSETILDKEDTLQLLTGLATQIRTHMYSAEDEIVDDLISQYKIELDEDVIRNPIRSALGHIAKDVRQSAERIGGDGIGTGAT